MQVWRRQKVVVGSRIGGGGKVVSDIIAAAAEDEEVAGFVTVSLTLSLKIHKMDGCLLSSIFDLLG